MSEISGSLYRRFRRFRNQKPDYRIPYEFMKFYWWDRHWDIHFHGCCFVNGELHEFETPYDGNPHRRHLRCLVYKLTLKEKLIWYYRVWLFKLCVYPALKNGFIRKFLCKWYYSKNHGGVR